MPVLRLCTQWYVSNTKWIKNLKTIILLNVGLRDSGQRQRGFHRTTLGLGGFMGVVADGGGQRWSRRCRTTLRLSMVVASVVNDTKGGRWCQSPSRWAGASHRGPHWEYCAGIVVVVIVNGGLLAGGHLSEVCSPGLR